MSREHFHKEKKNERKQGINEKDQGTEEEIKIKISKKKKPTIIFSEEMNPDKFEKNLSIPGIESKINYWIWKFFKKNK